MTGACSSTSRHWPRSWTGKSSIRGSGFGYRKRFITLEAHRQALLQPNLKDLLSYETGATSAEEIVATTYGAANALNKLKRARKLVDEETYRIVAENLRRGQEMVTLLN